VTKTITPTLYVQAAIGLFFGYIYSAFEPRDKRVQGILVENLVAAYFFRMKKTLTNIRRKPVGIPYPPETKEKNVDFLIDDMLGGGSFFSRGQYT